MSESRVCTKCGESKALEHFAPRKDRGDGVLSTQCRTCTNASRNAYRKANPERTKEVQKRCRLNNLEERRERDRKYNAENKERRRLYMKWYRETFPDKIKEASKAWFLANREHALEKSKIHYHANKHKEHVKERARTLKRVRRQTDPVYAMRCRVSRLISIGITSGGYTKKSKTQDILGCTWLEFKSHIERQFLKGMSWDNRSEWELDHIVPMSTAKTEQEVFRLNHHTNLRPLWKSENKSKSNKITHLI